MVLGRLAEKVERHPEPIAVDSTSMSGGGKRARGADILSSLDAAFASAGKAAASKYTSQAAVRAEQAAQQQAFAHKRKKKTNGKRSDATSNSGKGGKPGQGKGGKGAEPQAAIDPMYRKLGADVLSVGLRGCSLVRLAEQLKRMDGRAHSRRCACSKQRRPTSSPPAR